MRAVVSVRRQRNAASSRPLGDTEPACYNRGFSVVADVFEEVEVGVEEVCLLQSRHRSTTPTTRERPSRFLAGTGSGPPETVVAGRWLRGRRGLLRAPGWCCCWGVPCRRWSLCWRGLWAPRGVSGVGCSGRWSVVCFGRGEGGPVCGRSASLNRPTSARPPRSSGGGPVCGRSASLNRPTRLALEQRNEVGAVTGSDPARKWRSRNGARALRCSSVMGPGTLTGNGPVGA